MRVFILGETINGVTKETPFKTKEQAAAHAAHRASISIELALDLLTKPLSLGYISKDKSYSFWAGGYRTLTELPKEK